MPPFALSAVVRKAWELGRNRLEPLTGRPAMVTPDARYAPRASDGVLVLQNGPNPSTDYYLRPRLEGLGVPVAFADLQDSPRRYGIVASSASLTVIFCRYASASWLDALEPMRERLARVAYFMDDDLPAMIAAPDLPLPYRRRLARGFGAHAGRLSGLASEVWVSSDVLAKRYAEARPQVLAPLPDEDPPEPSAAPSSRVVYHSTGVHGPERQFVVEVARRLARAGCPALLEITGDSAVRGACAGLANVEIVPQMSWPAFRQRQRGASAAIALAPLHASPINAARAPVKVFEASRLGAVGLYADGPPYRDFVRPDQDGLLLPMDVDAWARAITDLLAQPQRRLALVANARARLIGLRRDGGTLPPLAA